MNIAVGLMERRKHVAIELSGEFHDAGGRVYPPGHYRFSGPIVLTPSDPSRCYFTLEDMTIGIGFHWERTERQSFRGKFQLIEKQGLTVINTVALEDYITSVVSSEISASCPRELLKAHAVISRSWVFGEKPERREDAEERKGAEVTRWYGREAHEDFGVCADDHCQRYQGIPGIFSENVADAVRSTAGEFLVYDGQICDARFSKCCGGFTENFRAAWADREVPYLVSVYDGAPPAPVTTPEEWVASGGTAYCGTKDPELIAGILPGCDQETRNFYRWSMEYTGEEIRELVRRRLNVDVGCVRDLEPIERGASGRIVRLKVVGERESLIVGKELEIRRVLSTTHLYSSAFVVRREGTRFQLRGAGWGHGVGLCQIGAAVMATHGKGYQEILAHYYRGATVETAEHRQ